MSTALTAAPAQVVVVVGAGAEDVVAVLEGVPVTIAVNYEWADGMASSIRCGIRAVPSGTDCVVIMLCDQPQITADHLRALVGRHGATGAPIVASSYGGVLGVPCAFSAELFGDLMSLHGDAGAREIIRSSDRIVESVVMPGECLDIDTIEDYERL